ncbi:LOW QUALITY PROTEIN: aquaporin-8-like [Xenia sp. Carnegie-2017]|uniref:LOW QUALITY PROTEIN: aquaporin-8-like n=1 Tax=Xenia sp. Carnegie-2017 TaxID=2897299 RepID=UPI001F0411D7|nr:LOW QUALITY PROTEIN: aquaporin-8-like [Xenia sp. Carnegie-2017]
MEEDNRFNIEEQPSKLRVYSTLFFKYIRPCVAELFGTTIFVFADLGGMNYISSTAFTHGLILFVLIAGTATVSGGHFNPAVTLALTIVRGLQPVLAPLYILSQLLGGIIGAGLARAAMSSKQYAKPLVVCTCLELISPGQGILAEALATSLLVFVVLMVAFDERNKSKFAPLAIGFTVTGGILAIGVISGGSMNPARSFGPAVVKNYWKHHYVYWVGPFLGSILSTLMYGFVFATPNQLWLPLREPIT